MRQKDWDETLCGKIVIAVIAVLLARTIIEPAINLLIETISFIVAKVEFWIVITVEELMNVMNS